MAEECVSAATDSGVSVRDVNTNLVMKVLESQSGRRSLKPPDGARTGVFEPFAEEYIQPISWDRAYSPLRASRTAAQSVQG
jgi:hypothetical protein